MVELMRQVVGQRLSLAGMTAAILTGLRAKKKETRSPRRWCCVNLSLPVEVADRTHLVDIVGTGGDGAHTFNISTASMFVVAAAGAKVGQARQPQRGRRSPAAPTRGGAGAHIEPQPAQVAECISALRDRFSMYAPVHHPAMKVVAPVRRDMRAHAVQHPLAR